MKIRSKYLFFIGVTLTLLSACGNSDGPRKDDSSLAETCLQMIQKREPDIKSSNLSEAMFLYDKENKSKVTVYLPTLETGQDFVRIDGQLVINVNGKCQFDKAAKKVHVSVNDKQVFNGAY